MSQRGFAIGLFIHLAFFSSPWEVMAQGCGIKSLHWGFRRACRARQATRVRLPELFALLDWSERGYHFSFSFLLGEIFKNCHLYDAIEISASSPIELAPHPLRKVRSTNSGWNPERGTKPQSHDSMNYE